LESWYTPTAVPGSGGRPWTTTPRDLCALRVEEEPLDGEVKRQVLIDLASRCEALPAGLGPVACDHLSERRHNRGEDPFQPRQRLGRNRAVGGQLQPLTARSLNHTLHRGALLHARPSSPANST
jgi:hypothetical protein